MANTNQQQLDYLQLAERMAGLGHWSLDLKSKTLFWSNEIFVIHGVTPETYIPTLETAVNFYHPRDKKHISDYINKAIEAGEDFQFSLRIVRPSGEIRQVRSKAQCTKDEKGVVTNVFGIFQDVTEQFNALETVEKVTVAHQALIDASGDGYWDWMIKDDFEYMSPRFWEIFGYEPEEKEHHPSAWQDMIFEDDLRNALDNFNKHIATKGTHPYEQEVRYRHKNGSTVTVLCRGKVVEWDEEGNAVRMIGTHTDITQLKLQQQALADSLAFQKLLLDINTDKVFIKDKDLKIVQANPAFIDLYPPEKRNSIIGFTTIEEYDDEQAEAFIQQDIKAFSEGQSETTETLDFPDGRRRTLLTKKIRFEDNNGSPYLLGIARDITELKVIEDSLRRANEELEEFTYRTSHDLRSPLISASKLISIIEDKLEQNDIATAASYLKHVKTSLINLEKLVSDILQMTKLNYSGAENTEVDIRELIYGTTGKFEYLDGFNDLQIDVFINGKSTVSVNKQHLSVILENLISNAIKYQDADKTVRFLRVTVTNNSQQLELQLDDNGLGFPENNRNNIFQMFKRFHPRVSSGSGLGLYMVQKSVQKMGGEIEYENLSNGSRFTVTVPFKTDNRK